MLFCTISEMKHLSVGLWTDSSVLAVCGGTEGWGGGACAELFFGVYAFGSDPCADDCMGVLCCFWRDKVLAVRGRGSDPVTRLHIECFENANTKQCIENAKFLQTLSMLLPTGAPKSRISCKFV